MSMLERLEAWFALIWHHFHAGTLNEPNAGSVSTLHAVNPSTITPPPPVIPEARPEPEPKPAGIASIDLLTGAVHFALPNPPGHFGSFGYHTRLALPLVPYHGFAWWTIERNCEAEDVQENISNGLSGAMSQEVVAYPDGSYGFASPVANNIPNVMRMLSKYDTVEKCVLRLTQLDADFAASPHL